MNISENNACMNSTYIQHISLNNIFNIGSGSATSIMEIYDMCATILNKTNIKPIIKSLRAWDPPSFWFNIRKAVKLLGYSPKMTLTEGILKEIRDLELVY